MSSLRLALLLVLAPLVVACDDAPNPVDPSEEGQPLTISPRTLEMKVGDIVVLRINGASTQLLAVWTSDNPEIANVTTGGFVRGNLAGTTTISVRVGDQSASVSVVVR